MKMKKGVLILPLVILFCMELAVSLECYYCPSSVPSAECTDLYNCTKNETICMTKIMDSDFGFPFQGTENVIKGCVKECIPTDLDTIGQAHPVFCCNKDRCNNRGLSNQGLSEATSTGASHVALPIPITLCYFLHIIVL
ncbi:ly6/PLAUR domain-containing protein 2 [Microcaecilia unicolor]|uniref:Ly6/PLAUR domain-containing protein 2-like n=1 Tax=Microcaecilia unicolor TaxID=1415580 RepID=A0A6P7WSB6_9AMPH|nr:ly6/PLAUR domain-containing protein 2-like [Microcaecilia unicolor]